MPLDDTEGGTSKGREDAAHSTGRFLLADLQPNAPDKLGNKVLYLMWCGHDYAIYRSEKGVFVHFSDCPKRETEQRASFAFICPELCELRYLTDKMRGRQHAKDTLYDYNIAQAIIMLFEGRTKEAQQIAQAALKMADGQATNDNTIRYVQTCCIASGVLLPVISVCAALMYWLFGVGVGLSYCLAAGFGVLGALFSILTRMQSLEIRPCFQSSMNYWMGWVRILIGLFGGFMLYLFAQGALLNGSLGALHLDSIVSDWKAPAIIGVIGGFAERLVRRVLDSASNKVANATGTPTQLARRRLERDFEHD